MNQGLMVVQALLQIFGLTILVAIILRYWSNRHFLNIALNVFISLVLFNIISVVFYGASLGTFLRIPYGFMVWFTLSAIFWQLVIWLSELAFRKIKNRKPD